MAAAEVGCAFFNWAQSDVRQFSIPVVPAMLPLLRWHGSRDFWTETRLRPILKNCGVQAVAESAANDAECMGVVQRKRRGESLCLSSKYWGYHLNRAYQEFSDVDRNDVDNGILIGDY